MPERLLPGLFCAALVSLTTLAAPSPAHAQEAEEAEEAPAMEAEATPDLLPRHRVVYESLTALRLNPLGAEQRLNLHYNLRLWDNPGILFRDAHVAAGLTPTFSPSVVRLGGGLRIKPLAVLMLGANAYWVQWFKTFGNLQSFPTANAEHSDSDLDRGEEAGLDYAASGFEVELQAVLQAKVGPIALANDLKLFYHDLDLRDGDTVIYDSRIDSLSPNEGWALTNDTNLVWISDFGLVLGLRGTLVKGLYEDQHFLTGEEHDATDSVPSYRLGPLAAYVLSNDDGHTMFSKPTLIAVVNWWVKHPYRTGQDVSQAYPNISLAFKFGGELWASSP